MYCRPVKADSLSVVEIRTACRNDIDAVMATVAACIRRMESVGIFQWDEIYPDRSTFLADIAEEALFVCCDRGDVVGAVALNERQDPEYGEVPWQYRGGPVLVAHRLCVHPDVQGKGVASRLMEFAEQRACRDGYAAIRLDAFTQNPAAVALYENRGYRRAGTVMFRKGPFYCFEKEVAATNDPITLRRSASHRDA